MSRATSVANWLLRSPLLWGGLGALAFYAVLRMGAIESPLMTRYFDSHVVERVAMLMFSVGVAALAIRGFGLLTQLDGERSDPFSGLPQTGVRADHADRFAAVLDALQGPRAHTHLVARLRQALTYVIDVGSADGLEEALARLEDTDRERVAGEYALPRLVRATLPIVGMLGTVIGITMAIGQLSPEQLEDSLPEVMAALSIAFDTTAQAMSLMLVLWFAMFGIERLEERVLQGVDRAAQRLLINRFQRYGGATDPNVATIRRMGEQVVDSVEQLATRQADTWQTAIDATHERWAVSTASAGELLTKTLTNGLREGLRDHASGLSAGVETQVARLAESVSEQTSQVSGAIERQLASLHSAQRAASDQLSETADKQAARLTDNADSLLGNLRDGLERMAELLVEALQKHGETLTAAEESLASENRRHLSEVEAALGESMVVAADRQEKLVRQSESVLREMQQALVSAAGATIDQQQELVKQGEVLLKVVESTGQVRQLEESLSRNLESLAQTHHFEETVVSLAAAVQLLSARLGRDPEIVTGKKSSQPKAA